MVTCSDSAPLDYRKRVKIALLYRGSLTLDHPKFAPEQSEDFCSPSYLSGSHVRCGLSSAFLVSAVRAEVFTAYSTVRSSPLSALYFLRYAIRLPMSSPSGFSLPIPSGSEL